MEDSPRHRLSREELRQIIAQHGETYAHALAQTFDEFEERVQDLSAIRQILDAMKDVADPKRVLESVLDAVLDQTNGEEASIAHFDPDGERLLFTASKGATHPFRYHDVLENWPPPQDLSTRVATMVLEDGQSVSTADLSQDALFVNVARNDVPVAKMSGSVLAHPLRGQGELIGSLSLFHPRADGFRAEDIRIFDTLCDHIAVALLSVSTTRTHRLEARGTEAILQDRDAELRHEALRHQTILTISKAVQHMQEAADVEQVVRVCLSELTRIGIGCDSLAIHRVLDQDTNTIESIRIGRQGRISNHSGPNRTRLTNCWKTGTIRYEENVESIDVEEFHRFQHKFDGLAIRSFVDIPLSTGLVSFHSTKTRAFSVTDIEILTEIADIFSVGVARMQDLLELQNKNRSLVQAEAQLQDLVANLPYGVCLLDQNLGIIISNPTGVRHLRTLDLVSYNDQGALVGSAAISALLQPSIDGRPREIRLEGPPRRSFEFVGCSIGEAPDRSILVSRDTTQERDAQARVEQQGRLAAIGELAAGIAHDFNNLLVTTITNAELILLQPEDEEQTRDRLNKIIQGGQKAAQLVRQVLDFSRQTVAAVEPVDLVPFLGEVIGVLEPGMTEDVRMVGEFESGDFTVEASEAQLQQVITNLVFNARDALAEAGGEIRLSLSHLKITEENRQPGSQRPDPFPTGEWVVIKVSDTGPGILPEIRDRIFEPFFTTKERGKGTGLGLAQVYGIVKQHNGYIDVDSEIGQGATFAIYLPWLGSRLRPESQDDEIPSGRGKNVLLVEDQEDVIGALEMMLGRLGYRVFAADGGAAALEIFDRHRSEIDVILTDLVMPDVSGIDLIRKIRSRAPKFPIVVMTGYVSKRITQDPALGDVAAWLYKPINHQDLGRTLGRALNTEERDSD